MRRRGDRAAREHGGVDDVEDDVHHRQRAHERQRDQIRIASRRDACSDERHDQMECDQRCERDHLRAVQRHGNEHGQKQQFELSSPERSEGPPTHAQFLA